MIDEETYKRELIRMWDILRGDEYMTHVRITLTLSKLSK